MSDFYELKVNEEDLMSMDGKCPKSIQDVIDTVIQLNQKKMAYALGTGLEPHLAVVLSKWIVLVEVAKRTFTKITVTNRSDSYCPVCKKSAGYRPYTRGSYRHKKGSPNYSKPLSMGRMDIRLDGYNRLSLCWECYGKVKAAKEAIEGAQNG